MKIASASAGKRIAGVTSSLIVIAGLMLAGAPLTAQAQIVKCIGKDGRIEFAANCPPGTKQQDAGVNIRPAPAPAPAASKEGAKDGPGAPKSLADRDAEFRKRQTDQKEAESKAAQKTADDAERVRACNSAKSNLQALKDRQRMFRNDPKTGERVMFEEADFQRELPVTERLVAENCKT
jgi:type IV secretory pathway VirB10-like protein